MQAARSSDFGTGSAFVQKAQEAKSSDNTDLNETLELMSKLIPTVQRCLPCMNKH